MLRRKKQYIYFTTLWSDLLSRLHAFPAHKKPEDIHALRLDIKKIKAFIFLLQKSNGHPDLSNCLSPLKKIFRHAGHIRAAQVNLRLISKHKHAGNTVEKELLKIVGSEAEKFCQHTENYAHSIDKVPKIIFKEIHSLQNSDLKKLYRSQIKKIADLLVDLSNQKNLHAGRKKIKRLIYTYKMLPRALKKKISLNTSYLEQLEELIGQWHDSVVIITLFKNSAINKKFRTGLARQSKRKFQEIMFPVYSFSDNAFLK